MRSLPLLENSKRSFAIFRPIDSPLRNVRQWAETAAGLGEPAPWAATLATVSADGVPSARMVSIKRLGDEEIVFSTALWTRKARDLAANPHVAVLFFWPRLERQAHVTGEARLAERELAEELWAERPRDHQIQAHVSRQGEPISSLEPLREAREQTAAGGGSLACPEDWGAFVISPTVVELWTEAPDRLHDRLLYRRSGASWTVTRLAP